MMGNSHDAADNCFDLFPEQILEVIPAILEGETLFSWCAVYHQISGSNCAAVTSKRLFGSRTAGFVSDFPGHIGHLARITGGLLGDEQKILHEHTLISLYSAFRSEDTMAKVETMMRSSSVERLKFKLGLPASRAATSHPLKLCRSCVKEEIEKSGIARWWIRNQWPTAWICKKHSELLCFVTPSCHGSKIRQWILPSHLIMPGHIAPGITSLDSLLLDKSEHLLSLTDLSIQIASQKKNFRPEIMRLVFYSMLRKHGWITSSGRMHWGAIENAFVERYNGFQNIPGFQIIDSIKREDHGFLGAMFHGKNRTHHPTKILLVIDWLFENYQAFIDSYAEHAKCVDVVLSKKLILKPDEKKRDMALERLVLSEGKSLNQAAQELALSIHLVIAWARRNNIPYQKRPRLESDHLINSLNALINRGASREEISTQLGIKREWITSFFRRHPDMRNRWQTAYQSRITAHRKSEFLKMLKQHSGVPLNKLRSLPGNHFLWLKKHEHKWLCEHLPML